MISDKIGIYIHVPFCVRKCPYCDFYSVPFDKTLEDSYVDALVCDMLSYSGSGIVADTLYFGGGTPILLSSASFARLIDTARAVFSLNGEITLEANPNSTDKGKLTALKEAGINRISFGVQSTVDAELKALGRLHSVSQAIDAVNDAYSSGIENISVDVMLGTPYQTAESIITTLDTLTHLPISHISAYMLKVEQNTPYYGSDILRFCANEDDMADIYLMAADFLEKKGFLQYEISNFAKESMESRHNLKYWRCQEYLGFGASAHSFIKNHRFYYSDDLQAYINPKLRRAISTDDNAGGVDEIVMLGLRLNEGIDLDLLRCNQNVNYVTFMQKAELFCENGCAIISENRLSLTKKGYLVSNSLISELLISVN